jgi:hypothetical protein
LASKLLLPACKSIHLQPDKKGGSMKGNLFYRWFWLGVLLAGLLTGCGKANDPNDSLRVLVEIPDGERTELFWFGVERKELEVKSGSETSVYPWSTGEQVDIDLKEGDRLVFRAFDQEGHLLVLGQASVGEAKFVSIPVARVL